jgi:uncharacterized protein YjbI with pentapeptide repeats
MPMSDSEKPELRPANDNPWYCLATLHGEQAVDGWDRELAEKNRRDWNRWFEDMTDGQRADFAEAFVRRTGRPGMPPERAAYPDFSHTHFARTVYFEGFSFARDTNFSQAKFSSYAFFGAAAFSDAADFRSATFSKHVDLASATFSSDANFSSATFSGFAMFSEATFSGFASFRKATFSSDAHFRSATFYGGVYFSEATFSGSANFINTKFTANTNFADARFEREVPDFRGATMHEATEWHGVTWPKPSRNKADAQDQVYAYERLKQEMERLKKYEDEQNFFRRELRARRRLVWTLSGPWFLNFVYQVSSDYGNSLVRPLLWLFGVFAIGIGIFGRAPLYCGAPMPIKLAAKLSFANIFVFLPDKREIMMTAKMVECLSNTTQAVSAVQSLLSVVLLFLLGLALRNRFRMR